ncbi:MAG: flagellar motor switch protein FliN [Acidobacteriota bacterium]|nr:flagellar motor switch protein FliN [Acidobacteriota bacterium]
MTAVITPGDAKLVEHVSEALREAMGSMSGQTFGVAPQPDAPAPVLENAVIWQQTFSAIEGPSFWLAAGRDLWEAGGRMILEAAGIEEAAETDCRSTWQEILNQTAAGIAVALTADRGEEITASEGAVIPSEPAGVAWRTFTVTGDQDLSWCFKAGWTRELASAEESETEGLVRTPDSRDNAVSKTFDLLLEVALPIAVSFGRTSLQIREVLKLNTGSIVELDRFVTDPVEVIVNNCVIARGEVVVVDGNYGVRINQLASREERLRSGMPVTAHKGGKA